MENTTEYRGLIRLNSKVMVSDPCYGLGTWCQGVVENVHPGTYDCFVEYVNDGNWGLRVSAIEVRHAYYDGPRDFYPEDFEVGVDSGQAGIFDYEYYVKFHSNSKESDHVDYDWYDRVGDKTFTRTKNPKYEKFEWNLEAPVEDELKRYDAYEGSEKYWLYLEKFDANTIDNLGFVSSSGYGDGGYTCWTARNDDEEVIAIRVEFIVEDEEKNKFGYYLDTVLENKFDQWIPTNEKSFTFSLPGLSLPFRQ